MNTKQSIFKEFEIAKHKDIAKSKKPEPREEVFTNRLAVLKSHRDARKSNRNQYSGLDINFDKLILAYSSPSPLDHFYKVGFGMSYDEYVAKKHAEDQKEKDIEKKSINN